MLERKEFTYDHTSFSYRMGGKGKTVMLIHGFAEDGSGWDHQAEFLQSRFQVMVPDLPGSGASPVGKTSWTMEYFADALLALLNHENIQQAVLIGHSMGGYITLAFAEKYPERLLGFGLFHSTAYPDSEERKDIRRRGIALIKEHGAARFLQQTIPNIFSSHTKEQQPQLVKDFIDRNTYFKDESLIRYYEAMILRPDRTAVLRNAKVPVLFVIGEQDNTIPADQMLQQSHLPSISHVALLKRSGHMGTMEEPARANTILADYLAAL